MSDIDTDFVHLARFALDGKSADAAALVRRSLRSLIRRRPDLADEAMRLIAHAEASPLRAKDLPIPVDSDTRLELVRRDENLTLPIDPIWIESVGSELESVVKEREKLDALHAAGLTPTRSLLFTGAPGVGKTLSAHWLANKLKRPLFTLNLAAVMSSFLGRTGNNIRVVLDYAARSPSVLLLDEFDAIAKRRDDAAEIGELKRLVTVLVQSIDEWPSNGLLIAATNHPELLDPAIWRRFDRVINFPLPSEREISMLIEKHLAVRSDKNLAGVARVLSQVMQGDSFADVTQQINRARREALMNDVSLEDALLSLAMQIARDKPLRSRLEIVSELARRGHTQRQISEFTGVARDTIRKHTPKR